MHDLLLMLSSVMPEEMILDEMTKALEAHKLNPTDETRSKLNMHCMLFAGKAAVEKAPNGVRGMMDDMDRMEKGLELMSPKKN